MNIKQACTQYALEVLGAALAILILCAYLGQALAAEPPALEGPTVVGARGAQKP
jgi:hypothetical protein